MTRAFRLSGSMPAPRLQPLALALAVLVLAGMALPGSSSAQQAPPGQAQGGCAPPAQPSQSAATPPVQGPNAGTAPGSSGSTGWTGAAGIGMTPQAPTLSSPTQHPPTVTGVNPRSDEQKAC